MTSSRYSVFFLAALSGPLWAGEVADAVSFERDILPILAERCTKCHGPDEERGGLRLTGIGFARRELESGNVAIVPGDPGASALVRRINARDPEEIMPPPGEAEPLTVSEKKLLERWITQGADWPKHWAYATLRRPAIPEVERGAWVKDPIDAFVLEPLEARGIAPAPEADSITLIRRLFYDLVGLVPTMEQVARHEEVLAEDREAGLERLVDDLLASEHFGERWGRHWLDKARYADSDGYEKDNGRPDAWKFRDWVIEAINSDLPVDEFTIEQLAGDLLDSPKPDQLVATAFNRQTLTNTEGGTDKEQWRVAAVMDRVETLVTVWMGLTLTCARCHTHKYDEITQREYYQLFAYFNNGDETKAKVPTSAMEWAAHERAQRAYELALAPLGKEIASRRKILLGDLPAWEARMGQLLAAAVSSPPPEVAAVAIDEVAGPEGVSFTRLGDGSFLAGGNNPDKATYTLAGRLSAGMVTGIRIEVLADARLPSQGPGRTERGNFVLNEVRLSVDGEAAVLAGAEADFSQEKWPVTQAVDADQGTGWAIGPRYGVTHHAEFGLAEPLQLPGETDFTLQLVQNHGKGHTLGRFRILVLTTPTALVVPEPIRSVLAKAGGDRSDPEREALMSYLVRIDGETRALMAKVAELRAKAPEKPEMDVRIIRERTGNRRATHVLRRGEFKQAMEGVRPGALSVLPPIKHRAGSQGDRLDLARWLVSGENPLPPRVLVNHVWAKLFGAGIVTTLNDFGVRGERPSHPRLLEWLAAEFVVRGWSRKRLIKSVVLSNTYRQSSNHRPELRELDPKNRLLARQNRFRVEAEIVRDLTLGAGGLLVAEIGGPSVFPPMPEGVSDVNYNSAFKWRVSPGQDRYRRGMYTYFKRTAPHPNLMTFDCPDSNVTCVQRTRSNTPLAALITLNNETFTEAAKALALRVLTSKPGATDAEWIEHGFRICLSRAPTDAESKRLRRLLEQSRNWYAGEPGAAVQLVGEELPDDVLPWQAASLTATVRVLLNLDEFLTRN